MNIERIALRMNEAVPERHPGLRGGAKQPEGQRVISAILDPEIEYQPVINVLGGELRRADLRRQVFSQQPRHVPFGHLRQMLAQKVVEPRGKILCHGLSPRAAMVGCQIRKGSVKTVEPQRLNQEFEAGDRKWHLSASEFEDGHIGAGLAKF